MIRRYEKSDFGEVKGWFDARGIDHIREPLLPDIGFIEPGVAAGFLYQTDSGVCILEGFVTNKDAEGPLRNKALNEVISECMRTAKELGFQKVCAFSLDDSIIARAHKNDFKSSSGFTLLAKEIK